MEKGEVNVFLSYFNSTQKPLILLDITGVIVQQNLAASSIIPFEPSKKTLFFADSQWWSYKLFKRSVITATINKAAAGIISHSTAIFSDKDLQTRIIEFTFTPIKNKNDKTYYIMAEGMDITHSIELIESIIDNRKLLEESQ